MAIGMPPSAISGRGVALTSAAYRQMLCPGACSVGRRLDADRRRRLRDDVEAAAECARAISANRISLGRLMIDKLASRGARIFGEEPPGANKVSALVIAHRRVVAWKSDRHGGPLKALFSPPLRAQTYKHAAFAERFSAIDFLAYGPRHRRHSLGPAGGAYSKHERRAAGGWPG